MPSTPDQPAFGDQQLSRKTEDRNTLQDRRTATALSSSQTPSGIGEPPDDGGESDTDEQHYLRQLSQFVTDGGRAPEGE